MGVARQSRQRAMMKNALSNWTPRPRPHSAPMQGRYVDVIGWNREAHGPKLWQAFGGVATNELLFHFGWPQMKHWEDLAEILDGYNQSGDFVTCIFCDKTSGDPLGMASYMSIVQENGVIETGSIAHGAALAKTPAATEGHYLMARRVFEELGYRRYEWKLNNPNVASHRAARRFGFTFEGVFRQHQVKPYGNRDTAWYSMLDCEWPQKKVGFEAWLADSNFDANGNQRTSLSSLNSKTLEIGEHALHRCSFNELGSIIAFQRNAYERVIPELGAEPIPMGWDYEAMMSQCEFWRLGQPDAPDALLILRLRADDVYLESLAVADHVSSQSIGKALMNAAEQRCITLNRPNLRLLTNERNPAAAWYERLGFEIEEREDRPGRVVLHFVKHANLPTSGGTP